MKLHLGCGKKRLDGYVNVDLHGSEHDCDIRRLNEHFPVESVDEIVAIHVCEHFYLHEIAEVLSSWYAVLKPGGRLVVELPCWDKVRRFIAANAADNLTRWPLFGDPRTHTDGEPALHKWCYSAHEFDRLLLHVGFRTITQEIPLYHIPERDMRWVAVK